jgi:cysteine desulfuration protein SufE
VRPGLEKLERWVEQFASLDDRQERIQLLLDLADRYRELPAEVAPRPYPRENLTPDCESQVYVFDEPLPDGTIRLRFAVENPQGMAAKALAVLLAESLSGAPLDEVAAVSSDSVHRIFGNELSMGKSMGLMGMVAMVRAAARRALR